LARNVLTYGSEAWTIEREMKEDYRRPK